LNGNLKKKNREERVCTKDFTIFHIEFFLSIFKINRDK